jgi:hypothetical protein
VIDAVNLRKCQNSLIGGPQAFIRGISGACWGIEFGWIWPHSAQYIARVVVVVAAARALTSSLFLSPLLRVPRTNTRVRVVLLQAGSGSG